MSVLTKGLTVGIIAGLFIGLGLGYALTLKLETSNLEQRISDLEGQVDTLQNETDTIELSLQGQKEQRTLAYDGYLFIEGTPGESTDEKHKDWIEVLSFSHGISQPASPTEGAEHQDFTILKCIDKSSPKLYLYVNTGERIPEVILELCENGTTVMVYTFKDVLVTSCETLPLEEVSFTSSTLPLEEVSFNYSKIQWEYIPLDQSGNVTAGWDLVENKPY